MNHLLTELWSDESGQDLVEYVLIVVLIAVAAVAAMQALGGSITQGFETASEKVDNGLE